MPIIVEIPELFSGEYCFHDSLKQCPFAWREPKYPDCGEWLYHDTVRCSLGLNNADEIDAYVTAQAKQLNGEITEDEMPPHVAVFSKPGPDCLGPGIYELTPKEGQA